MLGQDAADAHLDVNEPIRVIVDRGVIEVFANGGTFWAALEAEGNLLTKAVSIAGAEGLHCHPSHQQKAHCSTHQIPSVLSFP